MDRIIADPNQGIVTESDAMTTLTPGHSSQFNVWWLLLLSNDLWLKTQIAALTGRVAALEAGGGNTGGGTGGNTGGSTGGSEHITASFTATAGTSAGVMSFAATATTDAGTIASYEWSFGDGRTGSGKNVTVTYANAGPWVVALIVRDSSGNSKTVTRTVTAPAATNASSVTADWTYNRMPISGEYVAFASASTNSGASLVYAWKTPNTGSSYEESTQPLISFNTPDYGNPTIELKVSDLSGGSATTFKAVPKLPAAPPTWQVTVRGPNMLFNGYCVMVYGVPTGGSVTLQLAKKIIGGLEGAGSLVAGPAAVVKSETAAAGVNYTLSTNAPALSAADWVDLTVGNIQYNTNRRISTFGGSKAPFVAFYVNDTTDGTGDDLRTLPMILVVTSAAFPSGQTPGAEYPAMY